MASRAFLVFKFFQGEGRQTPFQINVFKFLSSIAKSTQQFWLEVRYSSRVWENNVGEKEWSSTSMICD